MQHTVEELILSNGARGLLVHIPHATVMTFELNFRAGEYLVTKEKWETPHLMEHLLLGANERIRKARAFQEEFEKNGAYCNASTGSYDIIYEAECADFEWLRVLSLLLAAISQPLFLSEEFEAEFGNVREELTARSNNHFRYLSLALRQRYGFSVLTDQERLQLMDNVNQRDIRKHYKATHTTSNMRFVIAGNFTSARRRVVEQLLEDIQLPEGDGRKDLPLELPHKSPDPLFINNDSVENLYFYIDTFMARRMSDPESDALNLINSMLTETLYSKILGTARERGLAYHVSSGFGQTMYSTNWWFGAQILPANAVALFEIILKELSTIIEKGKVSDRDIEAAKQYALGKFQRSGQTVSGTASGYSGRYFFDDHIDDYYAIPARIKAIERGGIIDISQALFKEKIWGMGTLGTAGQPFTDQLKQQIAPLWS